MAIGAQSSVAMQTDGQTAEQTAVQGARENPVPIAQPYLFEIRKGPTVSWILGTYHVGVPYRDIAPAVEQYLRKSRLLFLELADRERAKLWVNDPTAAIISSTDLDLRKGHRLSEAAQNRLTAEFKIPSLIAKHINAESCSTFLEALDIKEPRLDVELHMRSLELGTRVRALDTDKLRKEADQISEAEYVRRHGSEPKECNVEEHFMTDVSLADLQSESAESTARYRMGHDYTEDMFSLYDGIAHRNQGWMITLLPELNRGDVFIAVGAAHLYSERGMIALLERAGFTIRRL